MFIFFSLSDILLQRFPALTIWFPIILLLNIIVKHEPGCEAAVWESQVQSPGWRGHGHRQGGAAVSRPAGVCRQCQQEQDLTRDIMIEIEK